MSISRRGFLAGVGTLAAGSLAAACSVRTTNTSTDGSASGVDLFRAGVYLPLTGDLASNGKDVQRGLDLYIKQLNADGGINGHQVEFTYRDTKGEPKTAASIAQEYAQDDDIVLGIGAFTSTATMAAVPVLVKNGIPNLAPTSSHPDYTTLGPGLFRGTPTVDVESRLTAEFLVKTHGKKKIAIAWRQDDWGVFANDVFSAAVEEFGGELVASLPISLDTKDYRSIVTQLHSLEPEAVHFAGQYAEGAVFAQQLAATGWTPLIVGSGALYGDKFLELVGDAAEGWYSPVSFFADAVSPVVQKFVKEYTAEYGEAPRTFAAIGYDSGHILAEAAKTIDATGKEARQPLIEALAKVDIEGATGQLRYTGNGDLAPTPRTWLQIRDGAFVEVGV